MGSNFYMVILFLLQELNRVRKIGTSAMVTKWFHRTLKMGIFFFSRDVCSLKVNFILFAL